MGPTLTIDGQEYPMPNLGDLTMGQARIIKRYTGLTLEQVASADPSDPDLIASFCHLAIVEAEPKATFAQIEERVNEIKFAKLDFAEGDEEDASPPASTQNATDSELPPSGESSETPLAEIPETGLPRIGISA